VIEILDVPISFEEFFAKKHRSCLF